MAEAHALRRVFITGASSGLGAALALRYAQLGATLGLLARRGDALQALIDTLPHPEKHRAYAVDVNDHEGIREAAIDYIEHAGGIDVVIASAGISHGTLTEYGQEDLPVFASIFATNVTATFATFAPFIGPMKAQRTPARLVGIGSVAGIRGLPGGGGYSASKSAVITYCESLRVEMAPYGIDVVTICPGYIDTPMTQHNSYAMPFLMPADQFAAAAVRAIERGASYTVIPWQMGIVAKLLRVLPNPVYDWAFSKAPHKARKKK
ncbi:SDR family oxidoreductase [Pseudoduganella ginsengisoli]|uniref:SDR family oxidoreductase n=1 Tax=Pseudoduganella ginsengisoli TaxID=1462440 RepID=A0A6L6PX94_9BURK|nr:SDR family oxidoreductase [Pseudoduganella ginsengisoli]MTW02085.1 SDR family oxidoreductase [Pseudoduganella ginsengisoli]